MDAITKMYGSWIHSETEVNRESKSAQFGGKFSVVFHNTFSQKRFCKKLLEPIAEHEF